MKFTTDTQRSTNKSKYLKYGYSERAAHVVLIRNVGKATILLCYKNTDIVELSQSILSVSYEIHMQQPPMCIVDSNSGLLGDWLVSVAFGTPQKGIGTRKSVRA